MFVKPGTHPDFPGQRLLVRDPVTKRLLPEAGEDVPATKFWLRRLRDGDVEEAPPPPGVAPPERPSGDAS